ncbi:MAG: hypothetical protein OXI90_17630 [Gammaproteobacteria bacterium]|nr:hypothetical protein [Gammaproteobacteria bacterium]
MPRWAGIEEQTGGDVGDSTGADGKGASRSARSSRSLRMQLVEAARGNDASRVRALIESGAKGTAKQLIDAARADETNVVAALIESGAKGTRTQLEAAARSGETSVVAALIESGAKGTKPQMLEAACTNQTAVVSALAQSGVDINAVLFDAALHGEAGAIPVLVECGADPNATNRNGSPPLYATVLRGRRHVKVDAIRRLLEAGADPNASGNGFEPILHSVVKGVGSGYAPSQVEHIGVLLEGGADPDARDHNGKTALHTVVSAHLFDRAEERDLAPYTAAIKALLAGGATATARDTFGRTPLEWATERRGRADPAVLAALGRHGGQATVSAGRGGSQTTAAADRFGVLHAAVMAGDAGLVRKMGALAKRGGEKIDADSPDATTGWTLLHYAAAVLHDPSVGPGVEHAKAADVVTALLEIGADPNLVDRDGGAPLHPAVLARRPNRKAIKALMDGGADAAMVYDHGASPAGLAGVESNSTGPSATARRKSRPPGRGRDGGSRRIVAWVAISVLLMAVVLLAG